MAHFIPHPLVTMNEKELQVWLADFAKSPESLEDYLTHSPNPRWAASHLLRSLSKGLAISDNQTALALQELANTLATEKR